MAADLRSIDPSTSTATTPSQQICLDGCLSYTADDAPPRWERARQLLAETRDLDVWAAAAAADEARVRWWLDHDPALANQTGGPHDWPPLLHLTYSRLGTGDAPGTARALLAAGADPNAGYLWQGLASPFTALTGVFGKGEQGSKRQPPHPDKAELAVLLLEAGADPTDTQTLYNCMFTPENDHLELLDDHGLGRTDGPWFEALGDDAETWSQIVGRQLAWAAEHGFSERLDLFERWGEDLDAPLDDRYTEDRRSARERLETHRARAAEPRDVNAIDDGATALHRAAWDGDLDRIEALMKAGADATVLDHRFQATPLGWAQHAYQDEAAALIERLTSSAEH